jgi:hypothetical protein
VKTIQSLIACFFLAGCATMSSTGSRDSLDAIARDYVAVTLELGERDEGYVDAYYGPAEWRVEARANPRSIADLDLAVAALERRLDAIVTPEAGLDRRRQRFLQAQLVAAQHRIALVQGRPLSFAQEARGLYGVEVEGLLRPLADYDPILARIERLVPGQGPLAERVDTFLNRFVIPADRLDAVMRAAIAECRRRSVDHIPVPPEEAFTLEFVTGRSWSGYNWYQGNYRSLIQVNTDQPVRLARAVDLGCHEGYPGHHLYNMLLERELARGRGWVEYMVYTLYSPQSFIAEGSANYGIRLAFPGNERLAFETRVLYPLAGLSTADAAAYAALQEAMRGLAGARFTIARELLEGRLSDAQAVALVQRYQLVSRARAEQSIAFTRQYRAYVINYGLGEDLVAAYVERAGDAPDARWAAMSRLLSEPTLPVDLAPPAR